jgi:hypothetical protein
MFNVQAPVGCMIAPMLDTARSTYAAMPVDYYQLNFTKGSPLLYRFQSFT